MSDKLYTWIDVQNRLREFQDSLDGKGREWFKGKSARAYWDGLRISVLSGQGEANMKAIQAQLEEIFLARYNSEKNTITLGEAPSTIPFPVFFEEEESEEDLLKEYFRAGFSPLSFVADVAPFQGDRLRKDDEPVVLAFHSFKGGVGRTLHAITLALNLSQKGQKVLLIDADFEAPGISWYFSNPVISFADFIAMAHGDSSPDFEYTLKNSAAQIPQNSALENIQILPAFRDASLFGAPIIKPEHLNTVDQPFRLQDLVIELGKKLSADYVILDLRAGLSELSSGWLLDPKVYKAIVTTLSGQSLRGCQNLLEQTNAKYEKFEFRNKENMLPFLVFSQVPADLEKEVPMSWEVTEGPYQNEDFVSLKNCYISLLASPVENSPFAEWKEAACFSIEYTSLKNLPHSWDEVADKIQKSGIIEGIEPLEKWLPLPSKASPLSGGRTIVKEEHLEQQQDEKRKKLSKTAEDLIHADSTPVDDFLVTQPIEQLAVRHISVLPMTVVVGAKGSGKTYLFKSLSQLADWSDFLKKVRPNLNGEVIRAKFCKVTIPQNLDGEQTQLHAVIKENIEHWLQKPLLTASDWRKKWLDIIAWANGVNIGDEGAWEHFEQHNTEKVICLLDGLEELFAEYFNPKKEPHKTALRALLQDVPSWLESLPQKNIGLIVFIRQDIVSYVILQNAAQFLSKYKEFQLKWNEEEALRLAYWVAAIKAKVIPEDLRAIRDLGRADLEGLLYPVWGQKMGGSNSREARTADWVLDALSNFQDEVQSRDIVRFLHVAADISSGASYDDRLLTPTGIRSSIARVGEKKLDEVKTENGPLYEILEKVQGRSASLSFPCAKASLDFLEAREQEMLEKNGILRQYNSEYYLAEIYRRGLGISYSKRGKPRLL